MSTTEHVDAVIIGANTRGLVSAYVLAQLGYRAVLIERTNRVGGADASFVSEGGARFEHGLHVLDENRSELATRLFKKVVDGRVHRHRLKRGIVLRGSMMPYAPLPDQMPEALRAMLPGDTIVDDLGDATPSREALRKHYGAYADFVFDEVLPSYPTESRHLAFDVDESKLMANIYPWFFPRASRPESEDESRAFHDKLRAGVEQTILYPESGGFGGFAEAFAASLEGTSVELLRGAKDANIELEPGTHRVRAVTAMGRRFEAPRYLWAGGWLQLTNLLDMEWQNPATDRIVLGSFTLSSAPGVEFDELLFGDPNHAINRLYFPARFRKSDEPLMQIEFAFPEAEADRPRDAEHWKTSWWESLKAVGVVKDETIASFDFRSFVLHFNAYGAEGQPLQDADPSVLVDSNIHPIVPSLANLNLNRYVPRVVRDVTALLAAMDD
ncbi:MAG: NAD(P)-binding protein [Deltaproteobacteria bacterium]